MLVLLPPLVNSINKESEKLKTINAQSANRHTTVEIKETVKCACNLIKVALVGYIILLIILLVWWISIFKRTSELKCNNGLIVMILNLIFGPVIGELSLFILCKRE